MKTIQGPENAETNIKTINPLHIKDLKKRASPRHAGGTAFAIEEV
ncbi:hypothetical protein [Massilia brevitalea]|nr:hypothetical protein [Massilia brevitalea]